MQTATAPPPPESRGERLSDREMFAARPWRAPDRAQVIFAVVERTGEWLLALATLSGGLVHRWRLDAPRTPASFSEAELRAFYEQARHAS